ncbi:MAG TPA: thiamine pyrophosphate-dependent dehydrogenase E1 component subunit alpha [Anaerolineae bacterium]|nr:thiamine pyrophosphate-dependent dehydrogenase E1 component subunit alpha [Anaerolineae bacterium]
MTNDYLSLYRQMLLIRRFEEKCNALFLQGRIPSTLHLYVGQEAVAVGFCSLLRRDDFITSTHRPHGHAIAKGVSPRAIMAELFAKETGCCRGKGGSMHVGNIEVGMPPAIAIVGAGAPIAVGIALAAKMRESGQVCACFFGDGGANEGAVHEAMNMAAIWSLPVIFVVENNLYAASTPVEKAFAVPNIADRASAYGMPGVIVDGMDVLAVRECANQAIARARSKEGPTLVECKTYRLVGHSRSDARNYRTKEEESEWLAKDPITRLGRILVDEKMTTQAGLDEIENDVNVEIEDAVAYAEASPEPLPEETLEDVFWSKN